VSTLRALRRLVATLAALALVLLTAACERKPAVANTPGLTVNESEAANATYPSDNTASGLLRLRDGQYADDDLVSSELEALDAIGDLDGDGTDDRVVLLVTSTGGSGIFRDLYVLRRLQGQLQVSAPALLGDRVAVNGLRVERGEVVVDLVVQGNDDPLCCPTQPVTYRFRLDGNALVETTGQQRIYLKM
jgi:hypothetical protein